MDSKSDLLLKCVTIGITALLISLFVIKLYPEGYFISRKTIEVEQNKKVLTNIVNSLQTVEKETPNLITIPSVNIQLPVAPGIITNNEWTLYDDKVTWLSTSDTPGHGNVIIYGHDRKKLFGNLLYIKTGATIAVTTDKKTYIYTVVSKQKINPADVTTIISDKNQLTLYTCDGYFDQWRLLIKAAYNETI